MIILHFIIYYNRNIIRFFRLILMMSFWRYFFSLLSKSLQITSCLDISANFDWSSVTWFDPSILSALCFYLSESSSFAIFSLRSLSWLLFSVSKVYSNKTELLRLSISLRSVRSYISLSFTISSFWVYRSIKFWTKSFFYSMFKEFSWFNCMIY